MIVYTINLSKCHMSGGSNRVTTNSGYPATSTDYHNHSDGNCYDDCYTVIGIWTLFTMLPKDQTYG